MKIMYSRYEPEELTDDSFCKTQPWPQKILGYVKLLQLQLFLKFLAPLPWCMKCSVTIYFPRPVSTLPVSVSNDFIVLD